MSWRNLKPAGRKIDHARPRGGRRFSSIRAHAWRIASVTCALFGCWILAPQLAAQENPLREGESGYLQQLLPSLQKIQEESNTPVNPRQAAPSEQFAVPSLSTQSGFSESFGGGSAAGLWRPDPAPQLPSTPVASDQTEARLIDSRPIASLAERGGVAEHSGAAGIAKGSAKSAFAAPGGNGAGKPAPTRSEGTGKLAAFKGVESLQLDSTIVKIGLNTLLVLAASVGLIMVVRRGLPRQAQASKSPTGRLRIEQSLSLGGKAELKVVRCGLHQVLVAIDSGGIKSVVALEPSLEPERENLEPPVESQPPAPLKEPVNIEQFVKMIRDMEGDLMSARPGR